MIIKKKSHVRFLICGFVQIFSGLFVCVSLSSSVKFISFSKFNFNFSIMDDPLLLSERTGSPLKTPALFTFSPRSSAALDATYVRGSRILSRQNYIYITSYSHTLTTHTYITLEPQAKNENGHANDRKSTSFFFLSVRLTRSYSPNQSCTGPHVHIQPHLNDSRCGYSLFTFRVSRERNRVRCVDVDTHSDIE